MVLEYTETVKPLLQKVQQNILESRTLGSLRDSLLPKLMRGEVRVRDMEAKVMVLEAYGNNTSGLL